MEHDYPAAHSMDTQWYGVDRDGHVAVFGSGEAGAVPRVSSRGSPSTDDIGRILTRNGAVYDLRGRVRPGRTAASEQHQSWSDIEIATLLFLCSVDVDSVRAAVDAKQAVIYP